MDSAGWAATTTGRRSSAAVTAEETATSTTAAAPSSHGLRALQSDRAPLPGLTVTRSGRLRV